MSNPLWDAIPDISISQRVEEGGTIIPATNLPRPEEDEKDGEGVKVGLQAIDTENLDTFLYDEISALRKHKAFKKLKTKSEQCKAMLNHLICSFISKEELKSFFSFVKPVDSCSSKNEQADELSTEVAKAVFELKSSL